MLNSIAARRTLAAIVGAASIAGLAGLAPTVVIVRDRFTDNSVNTQLWLQRGFGVMSAAETNQRLQFSASVNSNNDSFAGLEVKNWGANWKYDFEIQIDYKLNLGNVSGDREVIVGMALTAAGDFPATPTGFIASISRDAFGLVLTISRLVDGEVMASDETNIGAIQGQLTLEWDRSDDRMIARVGTNQVVLNGPWAAFGAAYGNLPLEITIGCYALNGNRTFPGTRVYLDEFKFDGVKRARL